MWNMERFGPNRQHHFAMSAPDIISDFIGYAD